MSFAPFDQLVVELQRLALAAAMVLSIAVPMPAFAATTAAATDPVGTVTISIGTVEAVTTTGTRRALEVNGSVFEGDSLVTAGDGRLQVRFVDEARLAMRPDSEVALNEYRIAAGAESSQLELKRGGFRTKTGRIGDLSRASYGVTTPLAVIGVRGTVWDAFQILNGELYVGVEEGAIEANSISGENALLSPGGPAQYAKVNLDGSIELLKVAPPQLQNSPSISDPGTASSGGSGASGAGGAGGGIAGGTIAGVGIGTAVAIGLAAVLLGTVLLVADDDGNGNSNVEAPPITLPPATTQGAVVPPSST